MRTVTERKPRIYKDHHGWNADTLTTVNGQTFEITTMKRYSGKLVTNAMPVNAGKTSGATVIQFDSNAIFNKTECLVSEKVSRVTKQAVKDQHLKALALFDEKINSGEIEVQKHDEIVIGSIIFLDGYGKTKGSEENQHIVYEIENTDFGTYYKTVERTSLKLDQSSHVKPWSEKFGIGMYYDGDKFEGTQDELNNLIIDGHEAEKVREVEEEQAKKDEAKRAEEARNALIKEYPYMTPLTNAYDDKTTKKNMIALLKKNFPGVKFSVRKDHHSSYRVNWSNGPTVASVDAITDLFVSYSNDYTGDYRDYTPSDFNDTFGGFKYIFNSREISEDIKALKPEFLSNLAGNISDYDLDMFWYRFLNTQDLPAGASNFKLNEKKDFSGSIEEAFYLTFDAPEVAKPKEAKKVKETSADGLTLVDYSAKAFAIIGDTKPIKDKLKSLGGRFNFRLSCGAGWIFPKTKEEEVRTALNI